MDIISELLSDIRTKMRIIYHGFITINHTLERLLSHNRYIYISSSASFFSNQLYTDGIINRVNRVDVTNPPTTTVANGL